MFRVQCIKTLQLVSALALYFGMLSPLPASANIVESCIGDKCTVTFSFTGQMQTFTPPPNAKNLTFDALGAQGGRSGGSGGRVTGSFITIPNTLFIFVGEAGGSGSIAAGGFNGGGTAGFGPDLPGSGGGATDIRISLELSSRVVVAGGGGGRGAGLGSGGGSGGGLVGAVGRTAQGGGGLGGSQFAGGIGGFANGTGSPGDEGVLGIGGTGGSSTLLGGGGGGGGYFGGGGGGSDTDPCCYGAGGGGGGSSYADNAVVRNAVLSQGVRIGSGQVILRYQLAPMVSTITSEVSGSQILFYIGFSSAVSGFEIADLEILNSGGSCDGVLLEGSGADYQLLLSGCQDGELAIALKPNSVANTEVSGPIEQFLSNPVLIDTVAPLATWSEVSATGTILEFSEPIQFLDLSNIDFSADLASCYLLGISQQSETTWIVNTAGCEKSNFSLTLRQLSVADSTGNLGPIYPLVTGFTAEYSDPPDSVYEPQPDPSEQPGSTTPATEVDQKQQTSVSQLAQQQIPLNDQALGFESSASPPASSLPQASQIVTIPPQDSSSKRGENYWFAGLLAMGLASLLAGIMIARRGISGVLAS